MLVIIFKYSLRIENLNIELSLFINYALKLNFMFIF